VSGEPVVISYRAELQRKALHLLALVLPIGLLIAGRETALLVLVPLALVAVALDIGRQRVPALHAFIRRYFSSIMRPEEQPGLGEPLVFNGAVWMCVSAALCAALFPPAVAAAALVMIMIGDGAAAVVGRRFGRTRYPWSPKSVEGSAALALTAFASAVPIAVLFPAELSVTACAVGAVVSAVAEALPIPINDNIRVPLLAGAAMLLF
jgi:dolichol kinase